MKNIIKSSLLLLCSLGLFAACSDDNDSNPTLLNPSTFTLNEPGYSALVVDLATSTGIPFTWSQPEYGFPVAAEYQLQVSLTGSFTTDLADVPEEAATSADYATLANYYTVPSGAMNPDQLSKAINAMSGWDETTVPKVAAVYVRATSTTAGAPVIYSNVVTINVVPNLVVAPSFKEFIYEIGNESGWGTAYEMRSPAQDGNYVSYNWLDGAFKFKPNKDDWNGDWGQDPAGEYGTLVVDGEEDCNKADGSFPDMVQPAGFYKIEVSLVDMTWKMTPITNVSIIGGFNDWAGDVEMTWNADEHCWEVTTDQVSGEFKFRANHDWAINWGGDSTDALTQDGSNLSIDAGTYNFKLYPTYDGGSKVVITAQ